MYCEKLKHPLENGYAMLHHAKGCDDIKESNESIKDKHVIVKKVGVVFRILFIIFLFILAVLGCLTFIKFIGMII